MKKIFFIAFLTLLSFFSWSFELPIFEKESEKINLKEEIKKHKAVVVNFWASWCIECIKEIPELEKLKLDYEKKGVLFLAVNAGEKKKKIKKFIKKRKFSYTILEDRMRLTSKKMGVKSLPQTFVFKKNEVPVYKDNRPPRNFGELIAPR